MTTQNTQNIASQQSPEDIQKLIETAKINDLLAEDEARKFLQEAGKDSGAVHRDQLLSAIRSAKEAKMAYESEMIRGIEAGEITTADLEEGMKYFRKSDVHTKKNVFAASTRSRIEYAKNQRKKYGEQIEENKNLWNPKERDEMKLAFKKMNASERNKEMEALEKRIEKREKDQEHFEELVTHELMDDGDGRRVKFANLSTAERKIEIQKMKKTIEEREQVQKEIRVHTEASKKLCEEGDYEEATTHCETALEVIKASGMMHIDWFMDRFEKITAIVGWLENKVAENAEENDQKDAKTQEKILEEEGMEIEEEMTDAEKGEISDERKEKLIEMVTQAFIHSKRASAATVNAFVHATDSMDMKERQKEVDKKDNLISEDHEEEEDSVLCIENNSDAMMSEKVNAIAYDQNLSTKDVAIVDSDEKVLDVYTSDRQVNKNVTRVIQDIVNHLPVSASERAYLNQAIKNIRKNNLGRSVRDLTWGMDDYEAARGERFQINKTNFAEGYVADAMEDAA